MKNFINVARLIFDLGGTGIVAKKLNVLPSAISNWKKNNKIPSQYIKKFNQLTSELNHESIHTNFLSVKEYQNINQEKTFYKILLIISGGIACYKSLELIRMLNKMNIETNVILTNSAQKFINPILITSLNGKKCYTNLFSDETEENMNHIKLARDNDLILVVPATANLIGKIANGIANDLASTVLLASNNKIILAPSMNPIMWLNPAIQDNLKTLKDRKIEFIDPDEGNMACGENGVGRLPEVNVILNYVIKKLNHIKKTSMNSSLILEGKLKNMKVIITAGPTQENLDPIRHLSNKSSGKQGYAIAEEFKRNGANVTLISGPTNITKPDVDKIIEIKTADEMLKIVNKNLPADIFISTAAVADWKLIPYDEDNNKINTNGKLKKCKKNNNKLIFKTENTPDILKLVSFNKKRPKIVVGFAAETENLIANAKLKLNSKKLDIIVANQIDSSNPSFGSDYNKVCILEKNEILNLDRKCKSEIAQILTTKIIENYL